MALRKLQGFDVVVRKLSGVINERMVKMLLLGSAVRVTERQFPVVHRLYVEAATALDVPELPELFVAASPILNASTIGMDAPKIVLNSALVDLLDEDELRFVLGHELGHALSGHALYQTLLTYLVIAGQSLASLPFSGVGQVQRGGVRLIRRGQAVRACGMGWSVASWVVVVAWDLARTSRPR